jgi:hypothetical protein
MRLDNLPLADIVANDPGMEIIEDRREDLGYVLLKCPHDDDTDDHALFVCNPHGGLPAHVYCLSQKCRTFDTAHFLARIGMPVAGMTRH